MENYAGRRDADNEIAAELEAAGIKVVKMPECFRDQHEVHTNIIGELGGWGFTRAWYYWIASGPGIPPDIAMKLHEKHGQEVRVDGHCGCPSPLEWHHGFAVGCYHVDSQEGLNALAEVIRSIYAKGLLQE